MAALVAARNKTTAPAEQETRLLYRQAKAIMAEILLAALVAAAVAVAVLHKQALVQQIRLKLLAMVAQARHRQFLVVQ